MPVALVALSGFLVFPYFLPAAKVNLREFTEQIPLALAVMRVPRGEAEGDRHAKRMQSWQAQPVSLRDLTRPSSSRAKESLPLVLQYIRDHADEKADEVVRRVDQVEASRLASALADPEAPTGRERRKEMWRVGTAMETAALLLSRPRGKTVTATGEMAKRANEYLEAHPAEGLLLSAPAAPVPRAPAPAPVPPAAGTVPAGPSLPAAEAAAAPVAAPGTAPVPPGAAGGRTDALPQWLRGPPEIAVSPTEPTSVPVSTSDDPSLLRAAAPAAPAPAPASVPGRPVPPVGATLPGPASHGPFTMRPGERISAVVPTAADRGVLDARLSLAVRDLERRWNLALEARLKESADAARGAADAVRAELEARLQALESRPTVTAGAFAPEVEAQVAAKVDPKIAEIDTRVSEAIRSTAEGWAERFRRDLKEASEELGARSAKSEEDLRAALVAQLDLELLEAKEQQTALREQVEARVREILDSKFTDGDERRAKEVRELEQRIGILVDGRTKDLQEQLSAALANEAKHLAASTDDRVAHVERRLTLERDARLAEINEAHRSALAGLQVRMQSFVEQMVRENQAAEQEKYVELLARLKAELEGTISGILASPEFDARLRDQVGQQVTGTQAAQRASLDQAVADAEARLSVGAEEVLGRLAEVERHIHQREGDLETIEGKLRDEIADLDRRTTVINERVLPIVRQTWVKLTEHEAAVRSKPSEAQLAALRKEINEELLKSQEEFTRQTADLRARLETAVQRYGRIWLNFLRTYSVGEGSGGFPAPASVPPTHRMARRARAGAPSAAAPPVAATEPSAYASPYASDPTNPMDPELSDVDAAREPRRRPRKAP
jgi:hypothetical protein